jgi:hypothetical protein
VCPVCPRERSERVVECFLNHGGHGGHGGKKRRNVFSVCPMCPRERSERVVIFFLNHGGHGGKKGEECFLCVPRVPEGAERAGGYILFEPRGARGARGEEGVRGNR